MVNEVAIEPDVVCNLDRLKWVLASVGVEKGRILSDCPPGGWVNAVAKSYKSKKEVKEIEETKMDERLARMAKEWGQPIFLRDENNWIGPPTCPSWSGNIGQLHNREPFGKGKVVLDDDTRILPALVGVAIHYRDVDDLHDDWKIDVTRKVRRVREELVPPFAPLLHFSKDIVFIDPYFLHGDSGDKNEVISDLLKGCMHGEFPSRIECHMSKGNSGIAGGDHFKEVLERSFLGQIGPLLKGHKLHIDFIRWEALLEHDVEAPHPRFLFVEHGGMSIEHGFNKKKGRGGAISANIQLIGKDAEIRLKNQAEVRAGAGVFEFVDGFRISDSGIHAIKEGEGEFVLK
jgi:hypothetical protein